MLFEIHFIILTYFIYYSDKLSLEFIMYVIIILYLFSSLNEGRDNLKS